VPSLEVSESIRLKALEDLTQRYITDAERLGVSPEELNVVLNKRLNNGKKTSSRHRHPTARRRN